MKPWKNIRLPESEMNVGGGRKTLYWFIAQSKTNKRRTLYIAQGSFYYARAVAQVELQAERVDLLIDHAPQKLVDRLNKMTGKNYGCWYER